MISSDNNALSVEGLTAGYGEDIAVRDFGMRAGIGEIVLLRGVNGAGKSTIIRCLLGTLKPISGKISLWGRPLETFSRKELAGLIAYLPQNVDAAYLDGISVLDVVLFGRLPHHSILSGPSAGDIDAARSAIAEVGLSGLENVSASHLSGGETRRMFIAACLAQQTRLIILDEPFNQLDAESRSKLGELIRKLAASGKTFVISAHDQSPIEGALLKKVDVEPAGRKSRRGFVHSGIGGAVLSAAVLLLSAATLIAVFEPWHNLDSSTAAAVLWKYRLPRLLSAFLTGGILSAAGCVFQTIFRNPMASPYTLGTASGASFGAYAATVFLPAAAFWPAAFAGAMLSIFVVRVCAGNGRTTRLLLGGIACGYIFTAATMLLQFTMSPWQTFSIAHWTMGSVRLPDFPRMTMLAVAFAVCAATVVASPALDAMTIGDEAAESYGINVKKWRVCMFILAAFVTACAVAACGPVAFIGLVVPHAARILSGAAHHRKIPASIIGGGLFLAACDTVPRILFNGIEIPVGIITAGIGAPVLIILLAKQNKLNHD